jgi:hypothetical protein
MLQQLAIMWIKVSNDTLDDKVQGFLGLAGYSHILGHTEKWDTG